MIRARDTTEAAFKRQRSAFRAMSPNERLTVAAVMSEEIRSIAEAGVRARHPSFTDPEVARALARILLGPELAVRVERSRPASTR